MRYIGGEEVMNEAQYGTVVIAKEELLPSLF
jgi:hypothetical protein